MAAAAGVVFIVALIIVTLITMKIADFIIDSAASARSTARSASSTARRAASWSSPSALLFFNWLVGAKPPAWVAKAKSRPLLEIIGTTLEGLLPDDPENSILKRLSPGDDAAPQTRPPKRRRPRRASAPPADAAGRRRRPSRRDAAAPNN